MYAFSEYLLQLTKIVSCDLRPKKKSYEKYFVSTHKSEVQVVNPPSGHNLCDANCTHPYIQTYPTMAPIFFRQTARNTSIRCRFKSLTALEVSKLDFIKRAAHVVLMMYMREINPEMKSKLLKRVKALVGTSIAMQCDFYDPIERPLRHNLVWDDITLYFSKEFLRFRKEDLMNLFTLMRFPDVVSFDNQSSMSGLEVFIRGLYELVTGHKKTAVAEKFGRHPSDQSRAFKYFINHIYDTFHDLVDNNLQWWEDCGLMERAAVAIEEKIGERYGRHYIGFIDCNCLETDRPGGGPSEAGANSARWDADVQRAFYNGWKSIHGLKHQTVDNSLGFTIDVYGPTSLRRNDLRLFRESNINERMRNAGNWCIFGDSAYKEHSNCHSYRPGNREFNRAMKSVRISIEWNYMTTGSLFSYLRNKDKFKLLQSDYVSRIFVVAVILKNCHACYYGNLTMNYFNVILPDNFIHNYLNRIVL